MDRPQDDDGSWLDGDDVWEAAPETVEQEVGGRYAYIGLWLSVLAIVFVLACMIVPTAKYQKAQATENLKMRTSQTAPNMVSTTSSKSPYGAWPQDSDHHDEWRPKMTIFGRFWMGVCDWMVYAHYQLTMLSWLWKLSWICGCIIILGLAFTLLAIIPGSFIVFLTAWTACIVRLGNADSEDPCRSRAGRSASEFGGGVLSSPLLLSPRAWEEAWQETFGRG
jgi:hypothetical protein